MNDIVLEMATVGNKRLLGIYGGSNKYNKIHTSQRNKNAMNTRDVRHCYCCVYPEKHDRSVGSLLFLFAGDVCVH